ncbi:B3 DNA binding domain [Arabidopsis suecica]|uniref:B3 DNA binding domain n=1 Tax=Arabidopsis suecica TaxID=45249 RepID=A0A8T1Z9F9_ARASU|nr:B3 DNA binding domain [Arabidopsis suecica]
MVRNRVFGQVMEERDNPAFFKILRREDFSSEMMRMIPHHLIRSISDKSSSFKMVLKLPWGSSWQVKISKNPIFHYMEDRGWNQFVNDNGLGLNEFLTFTHEANMCFNVTIFEADGTEMLRPRKSSTITSSSRRNKREERKSIYKDVKKEEEIESWSESSYAGHKTAESTSGRLKQKHELNLRKKEADKTEKSKKSKKKKVDTVCNGSEAGTASLVPEFKLTIKKSHLLFLGIPKKFVDMHMPSETKMFKIHHPRGKKSWEVWYVVNDVQSRFSGGWSRLAKELGLVVGDVCTFELIKSTEMCVKVSKE